jgi:serine/threonine protein kinase
MGVVWRATDLELRRAVAIKQANSGDGEQIRREARLGAGLQHPNVIAVFDVLNEAGERWLVMEYLPSRSLAEILHADGSMPASRVAHIGAQITAALAAMHANGMVHRDVKPGNVLVAGDGTAKLTDLGIAMWSEITTTGGAQAPGTPGYIAPEVIEGNPATPASDMYALGITLSVVVAGAQPTRSDAGAQAGGAGFGSSLAGVLSALRNPDPAKRPTAERAGELLLMAASGAEPPRHRLPGCRAVVAISAGVAVVLAAGIFAAMSLSGGDSDGGTAAGPTAAPGQAGPGSGKLLFGIGTQANTALASELVRDTPTRMLTTWYHKPSDLATLTTWRDSVVTGAYAEGYALHLIVATWPEDDPEDTVDTKYGTGCGRPHPLSGDFLRHMRTLARTFAGKADGPPLFVTMFRGVNTYACSDGNYRGGANMAYYEALKDRYLEVREIFRAEAPNALVAVGWQAWQTNSDDPAMGAGRSMFGHFADVLRASDFQSVMSGERRENDLYVRAAVRELGRYGRVMVSSYGGSQLSGDTTDRELRALLTDSSRAELTGLGLFAWNFNSELTLTKAGRPTYDFVKDVVRRAGLEPR